MDAIQRVGRATGENRMSDPQPQPAPDPEGSKPPRFSDSFVTWSGVLLLLAFGSVAAWFRDVFDAADLFSADGGAGHVGAYVLFITGLLMLFGAAWFAIVEATRPPQPSGGVAGVTGVEVVDPVVMVGSVIDKVADRKMSRVLLAMSFVLLVLGAAGTGMINISIGEDGTNADSADVEEGEVDTPGGS